ncbi:uncharacterized protein TNIN_362701 [Trichonephila inaurata madagascariensis]|uniref:Uncharacterized protein n=1 Tax=Trichonephila inaurata madagascariensis TaxID=2747483 RepID=A0A8X6YQU8_9ARAC|nr:uncharacterized protein TNIN_362701 [Trichonephila inaurata madagascariensis]
MIPGLFVGNVVVCIVIFLFVINSKFRNRLITEWHNHQAKLLPASRKPNKGRKSSESYDKTPVTQAIFRTTVEEDIPRESKPETDSDSQVGSPTKFPTTHGQT